MKTKYVFKIESLNKVRTLKIKSLLRENIVHYVLIAKIRHADKKMYASVYNLSGTV